MKISLPAGASQAGNLNVLADAIILATEQVAGLQSPHGLYHVVGSGIAALDANILKKEVVS